MTQALVDLDHRFGSGHVRPVVVHYLNSVVSGLLAGSYREAVGRELFAAVARLTELAGYMAVDTGQPGLAQRYYIQALRLAQAAGDRGYGGYVLAASMSHLAAAARQPAGDRAVGARGAGGGARTGDAARGGDVPRRRGARARAAGRRAGRADGVGAGGRRRWSGADPASGDDPAWIAHFDEAYLADELAHCHRDLGQAEAAARCARGVAGRAPGVAGPPPGDRLRAARHGAGAAAGGGAGVPHRHCRRWNCSATLRSNRGAEYLDDFQQRLEPFRDEPVVREFGARLELRSAA